MDEHIILGLANAPAGTGHLIRDAITAAGWTVAQFLAWLAQPGHFAAFLQIVTEAAAGGPVGWAKAVADLAALLLESVATGKKK